MSQANASSDQRVGSAIKRLQLTLRIAVDTALTHCGLSLAQAAVLEVLAGQGPLSCAEAARSCSITRQSMQDVVKALHTAGLIEKANDPDHGRHIMIALTTVGRRAARSASETVQAIEQQMTVGLTRKDKAQLCAWIDACVDNLGSVGAAQDS